MTERERSEEATHLVTLLFDDGENVLRPEIELALAWFKLNEGFLAEAVQVQMALDGVLGVREGVESAQETCRR